MKLRKTFYVIYIILGTVSFLGAIQGMLVQDMKLVGLGAFCSIFSFLIGFIAEPRTRETDSDKKHDERCQSWGVGMLIIVLMAAAMLVLSSCSPSGYGCNGRSKCMTRVR